MNIGRLDRAIEIQHPVRVQDAKFADFYTDWQEFHKCFASLTAAGGSERTESDTLTASNRVKFKIRYFAGITEKMRILYAGGIYDIYQIQELGREGLYLWAQKRV